MFMDEFIAERQADMPELGTLKPDASLKYATMQGPAVELTVNNAASLLRENDGKFPDKNTATGGPTMMLNNRLDNEVSATELCRENMK